MRELYVLDVLKERLLAAHGALQDADTWTALAHDVHDAFAAQNAELVAEKLIGCFSLRIFVHVKSTTPSIFLYICKGFFCALEVTIHSSRPL